MDNIDKIWQEYDKTKNQDLKDQLIIRYATLVKYVAGRLYVHMGQFAEFDDLTSYGIFGLIDAIEKFDYSKGIKFETYASLRIRGSIIDSIRKLDWVPRTLRQKNRQLESLYTRLEKDLGRPPTDWEIANKLHISKDELKNLLKKSSIIALVSLEEYLDQKNDQKDTLYHISQIENPEEEFEKEELKNILKNSIEKLTEKEKTVVTLYYFEYLTCREISDIMNISESRVSQIHGKAILHLQNKLGKYKSILFAT